MEHGSKHDKLSLSYRPLDLVHDKLFTVSLENSCRIGNDLLIKMEQDAFSMALNVGDLVLSQTIQFRNNYLRLSVKLPVL